MEKVILVNENDEPLGEMEKMEAHEKGLLHRAFSVFIFDQNGELLLQQRAAHKYHSPLLWTNTCCSHPRPGEDTLDAANRRLKEEMGIQTQLSHAFSFTYKAEFDNGLTEHEFDHVFVGKSDDVPDINPEEVEDYRYATLAELKALLESGPEQFTAWFKFCFSEVEKRFPSLV